TGDLVLTRRDAQQIKNALEHYLTSSKQEMAQTLPPNLLQALPERVGEAWIDEAGSVRLTPWLLEGHGDALVLTYRPVAPSTGGSYQYVAQLEHTAGRWQVVSITFEKLLSRR